MNPTDYRITLALTYLELNDSERDLLESLLYQRSITRVITVDQYAVARIHYEFIESESYEYQLVD